MEFTEKNIEIIERLAKEHRVVKMLWEEVQSYREDGAKKFFLALNKKLFVLAEEVENADVNIKSKVFDKILDAIAKSGKIIESLNTIRKIQFEEDAEIDDGRSMSDKWADEIKNNNK